MSIKGGGDAPSPDPQIGAASLKSAQTGEQWLQFSKDAFAELSRRQEGVDALSEKVINQQMGIADQTSKWAQEDRAAYDTKIKPLQDKFLADAATAGDTQHQEARAAEGAADVSSAAATARATAARESQALGIRPDSGRAEGIARAGEMGTALGSADAQNRARATERARGTQMQGAALDLGNTLAGRASAGLGQSLAAGSSAYGIGAANQQLSMAPAQAAQSGYQGAMGGYGQSANILTNQYGLQLDAWKTKQEAAASNVSGIAGALGTFAGMAFMSDPKAKKNVKSVKKGKALDAVKKMPVKQYDYKPGQGDGGKGHVGPMADKFAKATGQPNTGVIKFQDAIGITMKAVQDLDARVSKLDKSLSKGKPKARRSSQSPAKARNSGGSSKKTAMTTARPGVKAQAYGIRRG